MYSKTFEHFKAGSSGIDQLIGITIISQALLSHVLRPGGYERFCEWEFLRRVSSLTFLAAAFSFTRSLESFGKPLCRYQAVGGSVNQLRKC